MKTNETTLEMPELAKTLMKLPVIAPGRQTCTATQSPPVAVLAGRKSQFLAVFFYSLVVVVIALAVKAELDLNELLVSLKVLSGV